MYKKEGQQISELAQIAAHSHIDDFLKSNHPICQKLDRDIFGSDTINVQTNYGPNTTEKFGTRLWGGMFRKIDTFSHTGKPTNVYVEYQDAACNINLSIEEAVSGLKDNVAVSKILYNRIKMGRVDADRVYEAGEIVYDNVKDCALVSSVSRIEVKDDKLKTLSVVTELADGSKEVVVVDKDIPADLDTSLVYNGSLLFRDYLVEAAGARKFYADKDWNPVNYFEANPVFEGQRYAGCEHLEHNGKFLSPAFIASEYIEGKIPEIMQTYQDFSENPAEQ